ncbi:TOMM precursor leader peptide-binding protein, partial [Streptomyces sp. NPDC059853]|uniref:TOMM precursor leader peptide-binding protein n=1 Tax=Streptomyces sp. NPDC059853 TaxID=3346973 RepID=UPI003666B936
MAAAFDNLAGVRPRIRRDVLYTRTPGGVLFHNADGGFHLTGRTAYKFATLLVPHLDGGTPLREICAGMGDRQREMVASLVGSLLERDFARDAREPAAGDADVLPAEVAERFAAQIAYVDHYADDARQRFARFRATRVLVLGTGETAEWAQLSLIRNGAAAVTAEQVGARAREEAAGAGARLTAGTDPADADVVLVTGADALIRTHALLSAGLPAGQRVIPVWTFGERVVTGPAAVAGGSGCVSCALLRLGASVDAQAAAERWSEIASGAVTEPGAPGGGPLTGPIAAMTGNLLGYEVFRTATGALPAETDGQILIQDLDSLDVVAEPLRAHPRCQLCGPGAAAARGDGGTEADAATAALPGALSVAVTATVASARDAEALVDRLNGLSTALVRPHAGVFARYDDESLTQLPLKVARLELPLGSAGGRRTIAAFDVHHLAGARLRALRTAAAVYVERVVPAPLLPGGPGALPVALAGRTEEVAAWSAVTSLLTKERTAVPAAALRPYGPHNRDGRQVAGSGGTGAGESTAEAAGHALLSALALDALTRALHGTTRIRPLEPVTGDGTGEGDGAAGGPAGGAATGAAAGGGTGTGATAPGAPADGGPDVRTALATDGTHGAAAGGADAAAHDATADAELTFLHTSARRLQLAVDLLDLGEAERSGAHVALARAADGRWAIGAGLGRRAAAVTALRDLLGQAQLPGADPGDPLLPDLAPGTLAVTDGPAPAAPDTTLDT